MFLSRLPNRNICFYIWYFKEGNVEFKHVSKYSAFQMIHKHVSLTKLFHYIHKTSISTHIIEKYFNEWENVAIWHLYNSLKNTEKNYSLINSSSIGNSMKMIHSKLQDNDISNKTKILKEIVNIIQERKPDFDSLSYRKWYWENICIPQFELEMSLFDKDSETQVSLFLSVMGHLFKNKSIWLEKYGFEPLLSQSNESLIQFFFEIEFGEINNLDKESNIVLIEDENYNFFIQQCLKYKFYWNNKDFEFLKKIENRLSKSIQKKVFSKELNNFHIENINSINPVAHVEKNLNNESIDQFNYTSHEHSIKDTNLISFIKSYLPIKNEIDFEKVMKIYINENRNIERISPKMLRQISTIVNLSVKQIFEIIQRLKKNQKLRSKLITKKELNHINSILSEIEYNKPTVFIISQLKNELQLPLSILSKIIKMQIQKHAIQQLHSKYKIEFLQLKNIYKANDKLSPEILSHYSEKWNISISLLKRILTQNSRSDQFKINNIILRCISIFNFQEKEKLSYEDIMKIKSFILSILKMGPNKKEITIPSDQNLIIDKILLEGIINDLEYCTNLKNFKLPSNQKIRKIHMQVNYNSKLSISQKIKIENFLLENKIFNRDSLEIAHIEDIRKIIRASKREIENHITYILKSPV